MGPLEYPLIDKKNLNDLSFFFEHSQRFIIYLIFIPASRFYFFYVLFYIECDNDV